MSVRVLRYSMMYRELNKNPDKNCQDFFIAKYSYIYRIKQAKTWFIPFIFWIKEIKVGI